jgi:hypothetical protein
VVSILTLGAIASLHAKSRMIDKVKARYLQMRRDLARIAM